MHPPSPAAQQADARRAWDTPAVTRHDLFSITLADPGAGTDAGQADQFS